MQTARFGVFEVDPRTGELRKQGLRVRLQQQCFSVLAILLDRPGELVTRGELQKVLWSTDTFVDFELGLYTAIYKLRVALGDDADNPRFVETLPRRGYRFIAPVVWECKSFGEDAAPQRASPSLSAGTVAHHLKASLSAAGNVLLAAVRAAIWGF